MQKHKFKLNPEKLKSIILIIKNSENAVSTTTIASKCGENSQSIMKFLNYLEEKEKIEKISTEFREYWRYKTHKQNEAKKTTI